MVIHTMGERSIGSFATPIEQGAELVDDYFVTTIRGKEHLVALGHLTEQTNSTVFAAAWQLKQEKWEPANVFPEQVTMPEGWQAEIFENQVTITNRANANVSIAAAKAGRRCLASSAF